MFVTIEVTWANKFLIFIKIFKIEKLIILFYAQICFEYCKGNDYQKDLCN